MASIRSIYLLNSDNKLLFSRKFLTIENRLKKRLDSDYIPMPTQDKTIINAFHNQIIKEELLQEEFKCKPYTENIEIDRNKMEELIDKVDLNIDVKNFQNYSECPIVTLDVGSHKIWPCIYIRKQKLYGIVFPNIDVDKYNQIKKSIENEKTKLNLTEDSFKFRLKKLYEEQDLSILGSFILIENILNYLISNKYFDENQFHTLISNMVPFGNVIETNINFVLKSLNYLNQKLNNTNLLSLDKKNEKENSKSKIPGWVTILPNDKHESLKITLKEELKYMKFSQNKNFNLILCDISCHSQLSTNAVITLPIKEKNTNYLGNLRIHPCAKIEKQDVLNDSTRIVFTPPFDEFKMGVFEIENFKQNDLPIQGDFYLKEASQSLVKIYLKIQIDERAIGKFEELNIAIPLGHFGTIYDTNLMVQVGQVNKINNDTSLLWTLQNDVSERNIFLSGSVYYTSKKKENLMKENNFEKNLNGEWEFDEDLKKPGNENKNNFGIDEALKTRFKYNSRSDIMRTNCFCKINFKLNQYSLSNIEIDQRSMLFYPKLSPKIIVKKQFFSNDFIIWNKESFNNYDYTAPENLEISLLKIDHDNKKNN